jgi:glycine betaine/proline transport system ATP-binding protein
MEVRAGEIFVVMGLSGSGKSTLLRMLNGLIPPCEGEVMVKGHSLSAMNAKQLAELRRHQMAMVFQSFALFPHRSVLDNAAFGLEVAGMPRKARIDRAMQALDRVGLVHEARKRPRELSGGMQQRVGLARALALDPPILLMDEAFSALDPLIRKDMQDLLLDLQAEHRRTVVFISHDLDEAIRIGDRIALMQAGRLLQCDTAQRLLQHPVNDEVRRFFRGVDVASVLTVEAIVQPPPHLSVCDLGEPLPDDGVVTMYVTDRLQHFRGLIRPGLGWVDMAAIKTLSIGTSVKDAIDVVATSAEPVPVLDDEKRLLGVISTRQLLLAMEAGG